MTASSLDDLKQAARQGEAEVLVTDETLARRVRLLEGIRKTANMLVFVILAIGIFMWANPINWEFLRSSDMRLARQVLLGVGIVLLFGEYLLPVVRHYRIAGRDDSGLRLVSRKSKQ